MWKRTTHIYISRVNNNANRPPLERPIEVASFSGIVLSCGEMTVEWLGKSLKMKIGSPAVMRAKNEIATTTHLQLSTGY
jgi:hypothetical protein